MPLNPIIERITGQLMRLPPGAQRRVLAFAESLDEALPGRAAGPDLLRLAGTLPEDDARQLRDAIEEACEAVEPNEW